MNTARQDEVWETQKNEALGADVFKSAAAYRDRMLTSMKDTVSEYLDEPDGYELFRAHLLHACVDQLNYQKEKVEFLNKMIANVELMS